MSNNVDIGPRKTLFILVVVVGCFSILWPKVFYPMLVGSANQHMKPGPIDKTTGCCDVISETDVNTIKIMTELCNSIVHRTDTDESIKPSLGKEYLFECRKQVLETCGIDIEAVLEEQVRLGRSVKHILDEVRSLNGSLCLKYNFGIAPWRLGVPHRVSVKLTPTSIRQERPAHMRPEMLHPALRERGRAIPPSNNPPRRIVEGRPGPIPGMRPPMGGPGHVVPAPQKGTSTMSVVMPIYTIGIVIFFTYTLMKLMFKKPVDSATNGLYPQVQSDGSFRKQVFESEREQYVSRHGKDEITTKLGWKERDTRDIELDQLRRRLRETELMMERIVAQMGSVPLRSERIAKSEVTANGNVTSVANGTAVKPQDAEHDSTSVKVLGMEMTASCEGGQKWSRPNTPLIPSPPAPAEPIPPPQSIYLEGALPAQSQLLVAESATETETTELNNSADPAVVLSGKMTLSVISLDSLPGQIENGNEKNEDKVEEIIDETENVLDEDEEKIEESKYTTASNATVAENDISEDEEQIIDGQQPEEIEED